MRLQKIFQDNAIPATHGPIQTDLQTVADCFVVWMHIMAVRDIFCELALTAYQNSGRASCSGYRLGCCSHSRGTSAGHPQAVEGRHHGSQGMAANQS